MKKIRVLAILLVVVMMFQGLPFTMASAAANDTIVLYPEYPEKIEKDYMYRVYVSQGGEEYEIPVYNSMRHSNNFVSQAMGTDSENDRRFCQFSANPSSSNPVTIKVVVNTTFSKYSIIPSVKNIASTVSSNAISFKITEAGQYVFRINDKDITNLAIFADSVETDVPNKDASNVVVFDANNKAPNAIGSKGTKYSSNTIFYIEDWQDVEFFELQTGQQLYIAPGAVLNARVQIMKNQNNIKIFGRGMLRDFNDTRAYDSSTELQDSSRKYHYLLTVGSSWYSRDTETNTARNVTIKDIVMFDAKGFNLVFLGAVNCTADNIKEVSNEISTDGISFWNCENIEVKNSFLYVADNIFVIDNCENVTMDNLLVGSSIATFFPQSKLEGTHQYTNINIFRSNTLFEPNGLKYADGATMTIENLSAIDCAPANGSSSNSKMGKFFSTYSGASDSSTVKSITFKNVTLPETNNSYVVEIGKNNAKAGNYNITLQNVYAGTTALTNSNVKFTDATTSGKASTLTVTNDGTFTPVTRNLTTASFTAYRTQIKSEHSSNKWVAGVDYYAPTQPYVKNSVTYISAKTTAEKYGFKTYFDEDDNSFTIYDEDTLARVTVGSNTALCNDTTVTLSGAVEYGEEIMVPTDFFTKAFGIGVTKDSKNIILGNYDRNENFAVNGDFEDNNALESWTTLNFARLLRSNSGHSSSGAIRMGGKDVFVTSELESYQGFFQDVKKQIIQNGYGTYRITFWAKCNDTSLDLSSTSNYFIAGTIDTGSVGPSNLIGATAQALTTSWKQYTQDIVIGEGSGTISLYNSAMYLTIIVKGKADVSVDDITITKVSDNRSENTTSYSITAPSSLNFGTTGQTAKISATDSNVQNLTFYTTNDYITVGTTTYTSSGSWRKTYTATASIAVKYPSYYDRTATIIAKDSSGVAATFKVTIPGTKVETDKHVVDFNTTFSTKKTVEKGKTLEDISFKLTNVLYNDGTSKNVTSGYTVEGADFSTIGEKTITTTYDNKSITQKVTVVDAGDSGSETPEFPEGFDPTVPDAAGLSTLGGNIRIADEELSAGLRFGAKVLKNELYDAYYPTTDEEKKYKYDEANNYQFGTIMIPSHLIPDGETVISMYEDGYSTVLEIPGEKVYEQDEESFIFTGVLVEIPKKVDSYTKTIQAAFYVRVRNSVNDDWTYHFSTTLDDSYFSVAERAYYNAYNYGKIENPTEEEKAVIDALTEILDFVEEDLWIDYWA